MIFKGSITNLQRSGELQKTTLIIENGVIYNTDIKSRFFITFVDGDYVISDTLSEIEEAHQLLVDADSAEFYRRYGFILPPFTLYEGVYFLAAYVGISLNAPFTCVTRYPEISLSEKTKKNIRYDIQEDIKSSLNNVAGRFQVLFSGGLDSSLLLAIAHEMDKTDVAVNCFMSSMPEESIKAEKMCRSRNIPFRKEQICGDLTEVARLFIDLTAEPVSDKIALVMPAMLSKSHAKKSITILDGQGADSLFSGLPQDKLYDLYARVHWRCLGKLLGWLPVWKRKNTPLGRKLYRVTKVLHSLNAPGSISMLIRSLVENEAINLSVGNKVQKWLNKELDCLNESLGDFHLVIRYFFMFRILPSREMQKYTLSNSEGYVFKLPFLEKEMVDKYFYVSSSFSIQDRTYKYPVLSVAKEFWPGYFNSSRTSPFQVEFETGGKSVSEFSLSYISDKNKSHTQG